jgi:hypothetical protein
MEEYFLLNTLRKLFREGACDLQEAANHMRVPLSVVHRTFVDGLLKGYWKVADGQLFVNLSPDCSTVRPTSPVRDGSNKTIAA